jgi:hypothetical protein
MGFVPWGQVRSALDEFLDPETSRAVVSESRFLGTCVEFLKRPQ